LRRNAGRSIVQRQPMVGCGDTHDLEREKAAPKGTALPNPRG